MVKVYAPASSANMSVGFDVLGAAVTPVDGSLLGDTVTVAAAARFSPSASVCRSAAIWSMNEPVPPAQTPFMRSSSPPRK